MAKGILVSDNAVLLPNAKPLPTASDYQRALEALRSSSPSSSEDCLQSLESLHLSTEQKQGDQPDLYDIPLIDCKHFLESQDTKHRYGTYLLPYHDIWASSKSTQPFFSWLDQGEGRYIDASKHFPTRQHSVTRPQLDEAVVHYCTKQERQQYRVIVKDGKLTWANEDSPGGGRNLVNTDDIDKWIFVIDEDGSFLLRRKIKSRFHHSSFVAGEPVRAAGRIVVEDGVIVSIGPNSGHYLTTYEQLLRAIDKFLGFNVDDFSKVCERCSFDMDR